MTRIVAVLTDPAMVGACLDAAAQAAASIPNEEIEAFHPRLRPEAMLTPEEILTERRRGELTAVFDERSRKTRTAVAAWVARDAIASRPIWVEREGDRIETLVAERGQTADLLVIVRPAELQGREALHAAIFDSGRLLLVVPPRGNGLRFGRSIAIAWGPSRQAVAAVTASVAWLKHAEKVSVILIGEDAAPPPAAADEALALLHPHGIAAEPVLRASGGEDVGAKLLAEAHALGADSLVMGAYRHNPIIEMFLGGVTRHMLRAADLPLFLMH